MLESADGLPTSAFQYLGTTSGTWEIPVSSVQMQDRAPESSMEIFNSDQGSQFTSSNFVAELQAHGILISMDGRGRCLDNAKMERFWWALKYEDIKIKEYVSLPQLRFGVQHYVNFYNSRRIHSALQYQTPDEVYFGTCNRQAMGYSNSKAFTPIFQ